MPTFNINTDDVIALTAKLERLHRSALPVAIRSALNDAAFKTKSDVPNLASRKFTIRQKNLYRKFITVKKAAGFNINTMVAAVSIDGGGKTSKITAGLSAQESGGTVTGRKLIPMDQARISGSYGKKLRDKYNFNKINIATSKNRKPGSKYVLIKKGAAGTVFDVSNKNKIVPIYSYRPNNQTKLNARPVLRPAAYFAAKQINLFYAKHAQKQINRLLK